jgi:hypothetical protein
MSAAQTGSMGSFVRLISKDRPAECPGCGNPMRFAGSIRRSGRLGCGYAGNRRLAFQKLRPPRGDLSFGRGAESGDLKIYALLLATR